MKRITLYSAGILVSILTVSLGLVCNSALAITTVGNGEMYYTKYTTDLSTENAHKVTDGNIYIANADGSNERVFSTQDNKSKSDAVLSPNGKRLAYTGVTADPVFSAESIHISALDGTNDTQFGNFTQNPSWAPDSLRLYFKQCYRGCSLATSGIDGENYKVLLTQAAGVVAPDGHAYAEIASFSDTGTTVSYLPDINNITRPDMSRKVLYNNPGSCIHGCLRSLAWSPDSTKVAFWEANGYITDFALVILDVRSQQIQKYQYKGYPGDIIWSPDGKVIRFDSDHDISAIALTGGVKNPKIIDFSLETNVFTPILVERPAGLLSWRPNITMTHDTVYRFWSDQKMHHFYTSDYEEAVRVMRTYPKYIWDYESVAYSVKSLSGTNECTVGSTAVYRFWSDRYQGHFYTIDPIERDRILRVWPDVWMYEGPRFCASASQTSEFSKPVYRFWSDRYRGHFYTTDEAEKDRVIATWPDIWTYERVAYYVAE